MKRIFHWLTLSIALLTFVAAAGGLLLPDLYRDSDLYKAAWQANDLVSLALIPALLISQLLRGKNETARLLWLGLLLYTFYNYAFYLFGAAFNWFFLLYALLFTVSLYTLVLGLIDSVNYHVRPWPSLKRYMVVFFLLATALPLAVVELKAYIHFVVLGKPPEIPTLILALDLTLVIPTSIVAAVLLLKNAPAGYILAVMMLVKSFCYGMVLVAASLKIALSKIGPWDPLLPFYIFIAVGGLLFLSFALISHKGTRVL